MLTLNEKMDRIQELAPEALVRRSPYTNKWYVSESHIEIGNGKTLTSGAPHEETPDQAVEKYFARLLTAIEEGMFVVVGAYTDYRRQFTWDFTNERWIRSYDA